MSFAYGWTRKQAARLNESLSNLSEERCISPPLQTYDKKTSEEQNREGESASLFLLT